MTDSQAKERLRQVVESEYWQPQPIRDAAFWALKLIQELEKVIDEFPKANVRSA